MKIRIWLFVLLVAVLSASEASVTERELRSAQERLGMNNGRYKVSVVSESLPNAGAYPDGRIMFNSGMLDMAQDEDEVAAVLAHEKTHVDQRHGARQQKETLLFGLLGYGIARAAGVRGKEATVAGIGVAALRHQRFSLRDEYRADEGAVNALIAAGYRPNALARLFSRLDSGRGSSHGSDALCFAGLKGHPSFVARQKAMQRQLEQRQPQPATTVGPILVVVENRLEGYRGGFYIFSPRRLYPGYDDPTSRVAPAMIDSLVNKGFDVIEGEDVYGYFDSYRGRYDESGLLEAAEQLKASHLIVALTDDNVNGTGNVRISTGPFGRRDVEVETASRKIRMTARLVQANRLIVWSSSKSGNEGAFVASYSDFGFFNGTGVQVGKSQSGKAVKQAAEKIATALRQVVSPASEPATPAAAQDPTIPPDPPAAPQPANVRRYLDFPQGVKVSPGQRWEYNRIRPDDGAYLYMGVIEIERTQSLKDGGTRAFYRIFDGELPPSSSTPLRLVRDS